MLVVKMHKVDDLILALKKQEFNTKHNASWYDLL